MPFRYKLEHAAADCVFIVQGQRFETRRSLLSARSEYLANFFKDDKKTMTIPNVSAASVEDVLKLLETKDIEVDEAREGEVDAVIRKFQLNTTKSYESRGESSIDQAESSDENETDHEASLDLSLPMLDVSLQLLDTSESLELESDLDEQLENHAANVQSNINSTLIVRPKKAKKKKTVVRVYELRTSPAQKSFGEVKLPCQFCPQPTIFNSRRGRHNHELTCSFNLGAREYHRCDKCGNRYLFKGTLALHVIKHLQVPEA